MTTSIETMTLRHMRLPEDAELLAKMWNDSDDQWPGTVSDGVPVTAEWVLNRHGREKYREIMVWDAGDAIAGFCSLWDWPQEPNVTYIATLNVAPQYQGLGLGRRFLQHYVNRAVEIGSYRLDLHTWSGNLKAVPLYKKCGFFWMPGPRVHMYNFLPTILTMPLAQAFFARHDWYASLQRELTQAEDDERWEGMKVFTYRFAAGDERLTVWVDREARRVTAVDTGDLFAAAIAPDQEPARGLPAPMRWRVTNRRETPLQVSLIASGEERLALDHRATLTVAPGETAELEAQARVAPEMEEIEADRGAPYVRSVLVLGGTTLELGTGMRPRRAVEVATEPEHITLAPGAPQVVEVKLRSRLAHEVAATVSLAPAPGLTSDVRQAEVTIPAGGYASVPLTLAAAEQGVYELPVTVAFEMDGQPIALPGAVQAVFALGAGGVLGAKVERQLRLENETTRITLDERGGGLRITWPDGRFLADEWARPVPPSYPNEFGEAIFDLAAEQRGGQVVATATARSKEQPGLVFRKQVVLGGGPVFSTHVAFENRGAAPLRLQVSRWVGGDGAESDAVLPLAVGLTRAPMDVLPGNTGEELKRAEQYAERWAARVRDDLTVGLVWGDDLEAFEWGQELVSRAYDIPPQGWVETRPLHWYVGDGDWRAVRRLARRLAGQPVAPATAPDPHIVARLERAVVATSGGAAKAALLVEHRLARPLDARVALELPDGWQADPGAVEAAGVTIFNPSRTPLHLTAPAAPGAYRGRALLRSESQDGDFSLPLIVLGDGRGVDVTRGSHDGPLTIDNGRIALDVTPGFGGTVSALRERGINHLATPYPHVATLGWMSPWYGGISPVVTPAESPNFPPQTGRERFTAEAVGVAGEDGIQWQGVRQRSELADKDLRGLMLELDTLTVGGSPVVKLVMRLINHTGAARRLHEAGWLIFAAPSGSRAATGWTPDWQQKLSDSILWRRAGAWAAAESPETGAALALVSPDREAYLMGFGRDGTHFKLLPARRVVPAHGAIEIVAYLVVAPDLAAARAWAALADV